MGNPEVESSSPYNPDDPQMQPESDQHQEQYDYASISDFGPSEFNNKPENPQENYQSQSSNLSGNVPKNQQQFQPPPESQSAQYPLQKPQVNPTQPTQPLQYPPQKPQTILNYSIQRMQYRPQSPQMNPINPTQPAQYLPQSPQTNPNNPIQPGQYPQQNQQANVVHPTQPPPRNYSPQANPQPFPPQNGGHSPQPVQFLPASCSHQNGAAYVIPAPRQYESPQPVLAGKGLWSTGLFDCMEDPFNALTTAFFPCLTFGQVAEIVDNGHTTCGTRGLLYGVIAFLIGMPCLLSCTYRTKLRNKYGLVEAPAPDWVTHFLCEWCALCQEYRELRYRGLDPSIGWYGNVARSQQDQPQAVTIPPMNLTMMR